MAYAAAIEKVSKITAKGQTTVPEPIRQALGVAEGDRIAFRASNGTVTVRRVDQAREDDPAIASFLSFLADDMTRNPSAIRALSPDLAKRIDDLVGDMEFDPDAPIEDDVTA